MRKCGLADTAMQSYIDSALNPCKINRPHKNSPIITAKHKEGGIFFNSRGKPPFQASPQLTVGFYPPLGPRYGQGRIPMPIPFGNGLPGMIGNIPD